MSMKIYLSNGTYVEMPEADAHVIESVTAWFAAAPATEVIRLSFTDQGKEARIQKQHIVQIDSAL